MADRGNEVDKLKRQTSDLVADLHARKLAIPAGILLVAIVAAMMLLPKSPAPPPPVQTAPVAKADAQVKTAQVANLKLVSATPLTTDPVTFGSENPFAVSSDVDCRVTKTSKPREIECVIGSTVAVFKCLSSDDIEICTGEGATGSSGGTGGGSTGSSGGGTSPDGSKPKSKSTYYVVDFEFDGDTSKSVEAGEVLPSSGTPVAYYAGPNSSGKKAIFVLADGISIQGAEADADLGTFELEPGDEVVLTSADGVIHQLRLSKIRKVTK